MTWTISLLATLNASETGTMIRTTRARFSITYWLNPFVLSAAISSDMRVLLASDEPGAKAAIDFYCYRMARELGSLVAALGGIDALVFTGGIGENAAPVRADLIERSAWLGFSLDPVANDGGASRITRADSSIPAWIIPADEESVIARHTLDLL